jgi:hypothetical protein
MFAPQTNPASPAAFIKSQTKVHMFFVNQECFTIARQSFPGLPMGLRRQQNAALRHVRLLFRCVAGGSTTTTILPDLQSY